MQKRIILLATALLLLPSAFISAATTDPAPVAGSSYNPLLIGLVSLMIILLFLIGLAANVVRQLAFVYREKLRKQRRGNAPNIAKSILLVIFFSLPSFHVHAAAADSTAATVAQATQSIGGLSHDDFYSAVMFISLELAILIALVIIMRVMIRAISEKPELQPLVRAIVHKPFWDRLNKSVAIEKEKDILLDHDYDGIKELDNSLPPWWKYGFYITILFAIIYIYRFDIAHTGPSSHDEYVAEMQKAEEEKAAYLAKTANNVDENNVTLLTDAASLSEGQNLFSTNCSPCHGPDGGGIVGPNLTDNYWLHGGSIKDVFKSIKYGWQDKGMKSWKDDFSPKQIQELASYIKSLHGTHPAAPKAPQGDLYIEGTGTTDSAKNGKVANK